MFSSLYRFQLTTGLQIGAIEGSSMQALVFHPQTKGLTLLARPFPLRYLEVNSEAVVFCSSSSSSRGQGLWRNKKMLVKTFSKQPLVYSAANPVFPRFPIVQSYTNTCSPAEIISSGEEDCGLCLEVLASFELFKRRPFPYPIQLGGGATS